MTELEKKYESLLQSLYDIHKNGDSKKDLSKSVLNIIREHESLQAAIKTIWEIVSNAKKYPKTSKKIWQLKQLINDITLDILKSNDYIPYNELRYACINAPIATVGTKEAKEAIMEYVYQKYNQEYEHLKEENERWMKWKSELIHLKNKILHPSYDPIKQKTVKKEFRTLYGKLEKDGYIFEKEADDYNRIPEALSCGEDFSNVKDFPKAIGGAVIIVFMIILLPLLLQLGIFGIIFLIGCPGLIISICKKAGK